MEYKINYKLFLFYLFLISLLISIFCFQNSQYQELLNQLSRSEKLEKNIQHLKHEYVAYFVDANWDFEKNISVSLQKQNLDKNIRHFQLHKDVKNILMLEVHLGQIKFIDFQAWMKSLKDFPWVRLMKTDILPSNNDNLDVIIELGLYR